MAEMGCFELAELGAGSFGTVYKARDGTPSGSLACKVVPHSKMRRSAVRKEVHIMGRLHHKHVLALHGCVELDDASYIFMELGGNGDLFSFVIDRGSLDEPVARRFFAQMLDGLDYLHSIGIVHRDLKLENVLLDKRDNCKICDFGQAHECILDGAGKLHATLHDMCGTKRYAAPEVLAGQGYNGFAADVWSCGICLFAMLAGFFPFDKAHASDWRFTRCLQAIAQGQSLTYSIFGFYSRTCMLSPEAAALIDSMLAISHAQRVTLPDACASTWLTGRRKPQTRLQAQCKDLNGAIGQHLVEGPCYRAGYANDYVEGPRYRSAEASLVEYAAHAQIGLQMPVGLDVHAVEAEDASAARCAPVYRSLGGQCGGGEGGTQSLFSAPPLARQTAFGQ
mmetsp:Transcript_36402/g.85032  ORF Transcript_36402/g.85032 Transcript_36402/m.85032 type:complete len:394 (-) Transcript_36402:417-1598(-)